MGEGRAEAAAWAPGVSAGVFGGVDSGCWAFPAARLLWAKAWLASPYGFAPSCQQPCAASTQSDEVYVTEAQDQMKGTNGAETCQAQMQSFGGLW